MEHVAEFLILTAALMVNLGLAMGLYFAALMVLRPVLKRLLTPQQRVVLWSLGWCSAYLWNWYTIFSWIRLVPVTFRDLITPRTMASNAVPNYFLGDWQGPGGYHLALPGGAVLRVEMGQTAALILALVFWAGMLAAGIYLCRGERAVKRAVRRGEPIAWEGTQPDILEALRDCSVQIRLCDGLDTSFLYRGGIDRDWTASGKYVVCLQRELPPERRELVLLHELAHVKLWHSWIKTYTSAALILHWWNPICWLANHYFCQDLELACDRRVLNGLDAGRRREYAKTLVELASGRQLWEAPLAFGECGAQVRVKAAAEWKPDKLGRFLAGWAVFLALALFALGGPLDRGLPQDILLALERQDSTVEDLTQWAQSSIRNHSGVAQVQVEELWLDNVESRSADLYVRTPDGWWSGCLHCQRRGALLFGWSALDSPPLTRDMYRVR